MCISMEWIVSQGSPEINKWINNIYVLHMYGEREIMRDCFTCIIIEDEKSHGLLSASWRPRKAGSSPTWRPEKQGNQQCKSQSEFKGPRARSSDAQGQEKMDGPARTDRLSLRFLHLSLLLKPSANGLLYTPPVRVTLLTESPALNANLYQKHPQRHAQKECVTSCLGIP